MSDKPVIGYVTIGPAHAIDPNAPAIDVPSIMRASGFDEGFAAGVEAAAKFMEESASTYNAFDRQLEYQAERIRELVKK